MTEFIPERKLALVGAGYWGKNLARNFDQLGALHTICDTSEALLDSYQEKYPGVRLTSNFKVVLDDPEIKQVAIAAPALLHYKLAHQALMAGKDVFVEKPLCMNSIEGEKLIKLAEERGLILMVGHILHFHPCVRKLKELIAAGELGRVQYITSNRLNLGSYRTEENALWNFAPHDVSVILSLLGNQLPSMVRCTGASYLSEGVEDKTLMMLKFAGDVQAHIYVSWLNPFKEQKLTVIGSRGLAVFDDTKPWGEKLILYKNHVTWKEGNRPVANQADPLSMDPVQLEPLREECAHFLKCCAERTQPLTDGHEGQRVLKVLQAAQESLEEEGEAKDPQALPRRNVPSKLYEADRTAIIDEGAEIGEGCVIRHQVHICTGAKLGSRCRIGQNVFIASDVTLGENVKVQNNVNIYNGVTCEDDVFLGPNMTFTNVRNPRSAVVRRDEYLRTHVQKGATIGAQATIICGNDLGAFCFVGAGAIVTNSVKPFALVVGSPARQIGWMSRAGERLDLPVSGPAEEAVFAECPATGEVYRLEGEWLSPVENEDETPPKEREKVRVRR
ncbi:MAG: Gfo/Idh/MocA family oxidoreductase [Chlamydiia bacterium]|nr:Gfo/Idh/MocA family oxidoreductase [Chlamydiia bacterium]